MASTSSTERPSRAQPRTRSAGASAPESAARSRTIRRGPREDHDGAAKAARRLAKADRSPGERRDQARPQCRRLGQSRERRLGHPTPGECSSGYFCASLAAATMQGRGVSGQAAGLTTKFRPSWHPPPSSGSGISPAGRGNWRCRAAVGGSRFSADSVAPRRFQPADQDQAQRRDSPPDGGRGRDQVLHGGRQLVTWLIEAPQYQPRGLAVGEVLQSFPEAGYHAAVVPLQVSAAGRARATERTVLRRPARRVRPLSSLTAFTMSRVTTRPPRLTVTNSLTSRLVKRRPVPGAPRMISKRCVAGASARIARHIRPCVSRRPMTGYAPGVGAGEFGSSVRYGTSSRVARSIMSSRPHQSRIGTALFRLFRARPRASRCSAACADLPGAERPPASESRTRGRRTIPRACRHREGNAPAGRRAGNPAARSSKAAAPPGRSRRADDGGC